MKSFSAIRAGPLSATGWLAIWSLLSVFHVTQAIWLSGLRDYPGDLGDSRFNNLVLEHGFLSLQGSFSWTSPGQFYPQSGILGLSDTHAGTLPLYALGRSLGLDPESAFQFWFVLVALANAFAMCRLLASLRTPLWIAGPCIFLGTAPMTTVWLAGLHPQMLPIFPTLFAFAHVIHFGRDGRWVRLLTAGGWLVWQFAASPYVAFFAAVVGAPLLVNAFHLKRSELPSPSPCQPLDRAFLTRAVAVVGIGGLLFAFAAYPHLLAIDAGHSRPISELLLLAPDWRAWFAPPPGHWWYAVFKGPLAPIPNGRLLPGFLILAGLAAAAVQCFRRPQSPGNWTPALLASTVLATFFFTAWSPNAGSLFVWLADRVETLRAFRASSRVIVLILPLAAAAIAAAAADAATAGRLRRVTPAVAGFLLFAVLETLYLRQPSTRLDHARMRREAVIDSWKLAGDHPILAFVPGFSNQPIHLVHLDAWSAALSLRRTTLNGYSGGVPPSHFAYYFNPDRTQAEILLANSGLPSETVSWVDGWESSRADRLGIEQYDSRPIAHLAGFALQPSSWSLFTELEHFVVNNRMVYQFSPPAEVRFPLPDAAKRVSVFVGLREGAYRYGGNSDGVTVTWSVITPERDPVVLWRDHINPRDRPEHRGLLAVSFGLPADENRTLILRTDAGPAGDGTWDWPVFGGLAVE